MSHETVTDTLEQQLKLWWGTRTPIAWDNLDYTPTIGVAYIRSTIEMVDSEPLGIGCSRDYYLYTIQVFTPSNKGVRSNLILIDHITDIFKNFIQNDLTVHKIVPERVGEEEEWHQRNVLIDVMYDNK